MKFSKNEMYLTNRGLSFDIIISGTRVHEPSMYIEINKVIKKLSTKDYEIDEKTKSAQLTDSGNIVVEQSICL